MLTVMHLETLVEQLFRLINPLYSVYSKVLSSVCDFITAESIFMKFCLYLSYLDHELLTVFYSDPF